MKLVRLEIEGIKNIQNKVVFDFLSMGKNKKHLSAKNSNVKAIWGENGAGKSAIINAMDLYKKVICNYSYFNSSPAANCTTALINKITKEFKIKVVFLAEFSREELFSHTICITSKDNIPFVYNERIEKYSKLSMYSDATILFEVEKGKILQSELDNFDCEINILDIVKTVAGMSSVASVLFNPIYFDRIFNEINKRILSGSPDEEINGVTGAILNVAAIATQMEIYLDTADKHTIVTYKDVQNLMKSLDLSSNTQGYIQIGTNNEMISKKEYNRYVDKVARLELFIKIFKKDLQSIKVKKQIEGNSYHVSKEFCYDKYSVDEEYESTGIKKLVKLFDYLDSANNGGIVFVDEIDANINDVYLEKLICYFVNYGKGQLIFTTHNTSPMETLKKVKHGMDFITNGKGIVSWVNNGHYSPESQYRKGMLPGMPFNVDDFDFISCFITEE